MGSFFTAPFLCFYVLMWYIEYNWVDYVNQFLYKDSYMKKAINILVALIPAILALILIMKEPFYSLDAMLCDLLYSQINGTGDDIKLITIDEETLNEYGPLNEWSREKSAELINVLYDTDENAPLLTAFDVMFIGNTNDEADIKLADVAKDKNIVTATNLVYRGKTRYKTDGSPYYDSRNIEMEEKPYELLGKEVETGYANAEISKDGFVRTTRLYTNIEGEKRYSFATQIYRKYMELTGRTDEAEQLVNSMNQTQFFYSGKPGEFEHYSLKDVLDGKIPSHVFADRIVMVGAYAPGLLDSYHSAAKRGQDMYGVEINANIVRALMLDKTASRVNSLYVAVIAAVVFLLYTFMARQMNMYPALLMGLWIMLANIIAGRFLATHGRLISQVYVYIVCLVVMVYIIVEKYVGETIKKKQIINSFKRYMAPQVIDQMAKDDSFKIEVGGVRRDVAVLFVDIRGFTTLSEMLSPEEIVKILNKYLTLTSECIFEFGGMVDKFIGDATMAIFNAPNDQEDYIFKAVQAGLLMQEKGEALGKELEKEYGKTVSFGVGIHMGPAVVGNIGSERRVDYTAIGDTVNTASRIEGKSGRGELLISEDVFKALDGRIDAEFKEDMALKGKAKPVPVYKVNSVK